MATSSIFKNFVIEGEEAVELFANAIEEAYQDSLNREPNTDIRIVHLENSKELRELMAKRKNNAREIECR